MHCELHKEYQVAFALWNCHCYTGQCRPTLFRKSRDKNSVTGYEIFVDGRWFDILEVEDDLKRVIEDKVLEAYDRETDGARD